MTDYIKCIKCGKSIPTKKKIKKGTTLTCKCGCIQMCLNKDEYISRWRIINPND